MTRALLFLAFISLCAISFQGCIDNSNNNNTGFFYPGICPLKESPRLTDASLCIGIHDCPTDFCSAGSGSGIQVIIGHRDERVDISQCNRRLANLSLHSCAFGVSKDAEIKSFEVVDETIRISTAKGAIVQSEDNDDKSLRLVSFYSLRCGYRNENSILKSRSLFRARLDEKRGKCCSLRFWQYDMWYC